MRGKSGRLVWSELLEPGKFYDEGNPAPPSAKEVDEKFWGSVKGGLGVQVGLLTVFFDSWTEEVGFWVAAGSSVDSERKNMTPEQHLRALVNLATESFFLQTPYVEYALHEYERGISIDDGEDS